MLKDISLEFSNLIATPGIHHSEVGSKTHLLITNHWSQLLTKHDQHPGAHTPPDVHGSGFTDSQHQHRRQPQSWLSDIILGNSGRLIGWNLIISVTKWDSTHNSAEPCHLYCVNIYTVIGKHGDSLLYGFRKKTTVQYILHFSGHQAVLPTSSQLFWISLSCVHICTKIFVDFFEPQQGLVPYEPVVARERSLCSTNPTG